MKLFLILACCINSLMGQDPNWIDKPIIQYMNDERVGLKISIPDRMNLQFFAFHGAVNRFIRSNEFGDFNGVATTADNNVWTYTNENVKLNDNDILYYWYHWQISNETYDSIEAQIAADEIRLADNQFSIVSGVGGKNCEKSHTIVDKRTVDCKETLIFEDRFNDTLSKWINELKIPSEDSAFVSYQDRITNIFLEDDILNIVPTVTYTEPQLRFNPNKTNVVDILSCTGRKDLGECSREKSYSTIFPPVLSAKIKSKFSFTYGRIEVRAKLPIGDWIVPEIHLEPLHSEYSTKESEEYSSGLIRIAFARGNLNLTNERSKFDGTILYGGVILEPRDINRFYLNEYEQNEHFGQDFHNYSLIWTKNEIITMVDQKVYGVIKGGFKENESLKELIKSKYAQDHRFQSWDFSGTDMAPFDKEFTISLGVSVGGVSDFADDLITANEHAKPWVNGSPKAELNFFKDRNEWLTTWSRESTLKVDYVRVFSV